MEELSLILQNQIALLFDLDILSFSSTYYTISASLSVSILAIFLPLSIEVANRLSDKYQSDVLQEIFLENEIIKLMLKLNLFNLTVIIIALLFRDDRLFLNKLNFLGFISFFITITVLYYFKDAFAFFVNFSSKKDWLLENIDKKMKLESEKEMTNRNLSNEMEYLDAKMKIILREVGELSKVKIKKRFDDLFQQYKEIFSGYKSIREKEENSIRIYRSLIDQWFYFYEQIKENDYESQYVAEIITEFIAAEIYEFADQDSSETEEKSNPELEYLLRKITTLYKQELNKSEDIEKLTLLAIRWYREYFYLVDDEELSNQLNKINLLNSYLRKIVYYTIESENKKIFDQIFTEINLKLTPIIIDDYNICYSDKIILNDIDENTSEEIKEKERNLTKDMKIIYNKERLNDWKNNLEEYFSLINKIADKEEITGKINIEMKEAINYFKIHNKLILIIYAGAVCIKYNRYDWLGNLWNNLTFELPGSFEDNIINYDSKYLFTILANYRKVYSNYKDMDIRSFNFFNNFKEFLVLLIIKFKSSDNKLIKKDISSNQNKELKDLLEHLDQYISTNDFSVYEDQLELTEEKMKSEFNDFKEKVSDLF
jgi:hypothetical protein